jgi:hypothetical protein
MSNSRAKGLKQSKTFRSPLQSTETYHTLLYLFVYSYCLINVYKIDTSVLIISKCQRHKDQLCYGLRGYDVVCVVGDYLRFGKTSASIFKIEDGRH